jgi:hypothetical protein
VGSLYLAKQYLGQARVAMMKCCKHEFVLAEMQNRQGSLELKNRDSLAFALSMLHSTKIMPQRSCANDICMN